MGPAGSGTQFTEIQAAIDAAQADDVILVRPGTYQRIVVAKPLRILGDGTGSVTILTDGIFIPGLALGVTVRDIRAGEELVLSGIDVLSNGDATFTTHVLLRNCQGTVVLHDMVVQAGSPDTGLKVDRCSRAMVLDSRITGGSGSSFGTPTSGSGIQAVNSTLWIANSRITCEAFFPSASPGVEVRNTTLHVWRTSIRGGDLGGVVNDSIGDAGGHGIQAAASTLNLFGGPGSALTGGQGSLIEDPLEIGHYPFPGGNGLYLTQGSHARVQASIAIQGGWNGDHTALAAPTAVGDFTSSITFDAKTFASLASSVQQAPIGTSFGLTLDGNAGGYQVLYMSLRTGPTSTHPGVDGFGLLDTASLFKLESEFLPASGTFTRTVRVPSTPTLIGSTLFFQNVERFPNSALRQLTPANRFAIGNPVLVTITP